VAVKAAPTRSKATDDLGRIVDLQELDGSWTNPSTLGISSAIWRELASQPEGESIFATVFALALLRTKAGERKAAWALLEQKALKWLQSHGVTDAEALIQRAIGEIRA
jgi:hypothetical protein